MNESISMEKYRPVQHYGRIGSDSPKGFEETRSFSDLSTEELQRLKKLAHAYVRVHLAENLPRSLSDWRRDYLRNVAIYVHNILDEVSDDSDIAISPVDSSAKNLLRHRYRVRRHVLSREFFFREQVFTFLSEFLQLHKSGLISQFPKLEFNDHDSSFTLAYEVLRDNVGLDIEDQCRQITVPSYPSTRLSIDAPSIFRTDSVRNWVAKCLRNIGRSSQNPEDVIRLRRGVPSSELRYIMGLIEQPSRVFSLFTRNAITYRVPYILEAHGVASISDLYCRLDHLSQHKNDRRDIERISSALMTTCESSERARELAYLYVAIPGNLFYRPPIDDDQGCGLELRCIDRDRSVMHVRNIYEYQRLYRFFSPISRLFFGTDAVELNVLATLDSFFYLAYMPIAPFDNKPPHRRHSAWRCDRSGCFQIVLNDCQEGQADDDGYHHLLKELIRDEFTAVDSMILNELILFQGR